MSKTPAAHHKPVANPKGNHSGEVESERALPLTATQAIAAMKADKPKPEPTPEPETEAQAIARGIEDRRKAAEVEAS
jgi:hypothetical protein